MLAAFLIVLVISLMRARARDLRCLGLGGLVRPWASSLFLGLPAVVRASPPVALRNIGWPWAVWAGDAFGCSGVALGLQRFGVAKGGFGWTGVTLDDLDRQAVNTSSSEESCGCVHFESVPRSGSTKAGQDGPLQVYA